MSRGICRIRSDDELDIAILGLANEKGKFAISIGPIPDQEIQDAFERGIDNDWWTLVDIGPIEHSPWPREWMRVFKLTPAGIARRDELKKIFGEGVGGDDSPAEAES